MLAYRSMTNQNCSVDGLNVPAPMHGIKVFSRTAATLNRNRKAEYDDADLIERLKAGDEEALELIFTRYSAKLYNVAQKILGEVADAEEVIQDVFWTAFRKAKSFRGTAQFSTWLYRLTSQRGPRQDSPEQEDQRNRIRGVPTKVSDKTATTWCGLWSIGPTHWMKNTPNGNCSSC